MSFLSFAHRCGGVLHGHTRRCGPQGSTHSMIIFKADLSLRWKKAKHRKRSQVENIWRFYIFKIVFLPDMHNSSIHVGLLKYCLEDQHLHPINDKLCHWLEIVGSQTLSVYHLYFISGPFHQFPAAWKEVSRNNVTGFDHSKNSWMWLQLYF